MNSSTNMRYAKCHFSLNQLSDSLKDSSRPYLIQLRASSLLQTIACFEALFRGLPSQKPTSIVCDEEKRDLLQPTGPHRQLVGALSLVNHKGLHQGWKHTSIHLLLIPHRRHQTANFFKFHKTSLDTNIKQNIQTSNTIFRRNSPSNITLVLKKTNKHKARTCCHRGLSSDLSIPFFFFNYRKRNGHKKLLIFLKNYIHA